MENGRMEWMSVGCIEQSSMNSRSIGQPLEIARKQRLIDKLKYAFGVRFRSLDSTLCHWSAVIFKYRSLKLYFNWKLHESTIRSVYIGISWCIWWSTTRFCSQWFQFRMRVSDMKFDRNEHFLGIFIPFIKHHGWESLHRYCMLKWKIKVERKVESPE